MKVFEVDSERKLLLGGAFSCSYVLITICVAFEKVLKAFVDTSLNKLQH